MRSGLTGSTAPSGVVPATMGMITELLGKPYI
ncbi:hypothetical protein DFQ04_1026 [Algoriphagus boseongensis]|uniref:Uncharacterized protein n=1 Tax=Algoriphagus boseongensis TaxID=1442587 RepID=A0A4R6TAI8_9BACT|nr:hypothetical protein DFQ04_1026 [Algoriphagus boseongensis]